MPSPARPRTPRTPARPRAARTRFPSARLTGLTVESELGFVDLVAVKRALGGDDRVRLTAAERAWICHRQRPGARRQAAYALGTGYTGLLRDLERHRRRMARAAKDTPAPDDRPR